MASKPCKLIEVDVIGAQPAQAAFDRADEMEARRADVVGAGSSAESALGGDDHLVAASADRLAENLLSRAAE
jgi:hypothetical protein